MNYKEFIARVDDLTKKVTEVINEIYATYDNIAVPCREVVTVDEVSMKEALAEIRARILESFSLFNDFARFMAVDVDDKRTDADGITHFESYLSDITLYVNKFFDTSKEVVSNITGTYYKNAEEDVEPRESSYNEKLEAIVNCLNNILDDLYEINYFLNATETVEDSDCDVTEKDTLVNLTPNVDDSNTKAFDDNSAINLTE